MIAIFLALVIGVQGPTARPSERAAAWSEALELDLVEQVAREGAELQGATGLGDDGQCTALYARALALRGERARAQEVLDAARPSEATRPWVELERARRMLEDDDLDPALRALSAPSGLAPRFPSFPENSLWLGRALARSGRGQEAVAHFLRFIELAPLSPDVPSALHHLAQAAIARNDPRSAEELVGRARALGTWHDFYRARRLQVREHPREPLPRLGLAQLLLEAGEFARAEITLRELVALAPDFASGWFHLGEARRKQSDLTEAGRCYTRALELDPAQHTARFNRAVIALTDKRDGDARADLETLVAGPGGEDARLLRAHLELARILVRAGDADGAQARYAQYTARGGSEPLDKAP